MCVCVCVCVCEGKDACEEGEGRADGFTIAADENTAPNTHLEPCNSPGDLFYQSGVFDVCRYLVSVNLQGLRA